MSYVKKVDKTITKEFRTIINYYQHEKTYVISRKKIGNTFLNAQQIFAQLAIYIVLSIHLYHSSCKWFFINTSPPSEWTFVLKSNKQLQNLPLESKDIKSFLIIDK